MTGWLVETLYAVTVLMLLVLAVRRPVARVFGAGWAYALWLLPALRLVLPPLHIFGTAIPSVLPRAPAASSSIEAAAALPAGDPAFGWEPLLLSVWAAGALLFIAWQVWSYHAFLRRIGIGSRIHASLAQDIGIVESPAVEGPIAIGLLDRWIVIPADFTSRYSPVEQRLALRHERIHHQREDIFCNMVALGVLALNWFNPVAYAAFRAFRADQELSCDAAVAAQATRSERHDYARALVKSASKPGIIAACPLNHAGQLKRRLRMIKDHRKSGLRAFGGSSAVGLLILGGISVTETAVVARAPAPVAPVAAVKQASPAPAAKPAAQANVAPTPRAEAKAAKVTAKAPAAPLARASTVAAAAPVVQPVPAPSVAPAPEPPAVPETWPTPAPAPAPEAVVMSGEPVAAEPAKRKRKAHRYEVVRTHVRTIDGQTEMQLKIESLIEARQRKTAMKIAGAPEK